MKYLVLGSAGQIGRPLVKFLRGKGHEVFEHDAKDSQDEDLRDSANNLRLLEKIVTSDFVFFLAWDVGGSKYLEAKENDYEYIKNNLDISKNVFHFLRMYKKPFIFASSQMVLKQDSTYGATKFIGEKYTSAINGISVRLWNVYGEEESGERAHVITDFINMSNNSSFIHMASYGNEKRQFLSVDDCSKVLYLISQDFSRFKDEKEIIDVSSFKWRSIFDIAEIVQRIYADHHGINVKIKRGKYHYNQGTESKPTPDRYILKYWKPKVSLEEGIKCLIHKSRSSI